jgi:hypothetical protein
MKILLNSIFLLILSIQCFSQNIGKKNLNLVFYNDCSGKIIKPEFEIDSIPESKNMKILTYFIDRGEWVSHNTITIDISKKDTIRTPRILFSGGNELHSQQWNYLNCDKISNGIETDFYSNGNKRLVGQFINGKPKEIKIFRENGTLENQEFYEIGYLKFTRINYFDNSGELFEYEIYKNRKRKTIIKTYNKKGKLVSRKIQRFYIEKTKWN